MDYDDEDEEEKQVVPIKTGPKRYFNELIGDDSDDTPELRRDALAAT